MKKYSIELDVIGHQRQRLVSDIEEFVLTQSMHDDVSVNYSPPSNTMRGTPESILVAAFALSVLRMILNFLVNWVKINRTQLRVSVGDITTFIDSSDPKSLEKVQDLIGDLLENNALQEKNRDERE